MNYLLAALQMFFHSLYLPYNSVAILVYSDSLITQGLARMLMV